MCGQSKRSVRELKVFYKEPLEDRVNTAFAVEGRYRDVPIIIDKNDYIIDGYHRYYYHVKNDIEFINTIKLDITFEESKDWRMADSCIKAFSSLIKNKELYERFKLLW